MKILYIPLFLVLLCVATPSFSQDFSKVDSIVQSYPERMRSMEALTDRIATDFKTDVEKVRAVYVWMTNHIEYDHEEHAKFNFTYRTKDQLKRKEKKRDKKLVKRVFAKRKAVCEGYAVLFAKLCNLLSVKAFMVTGSSKNEIRDIGKRFWSDHAWNIAEIDGKRYLFDATWDIKRKSKNYRYFMPDPNDFFLDHYPRYFNHSLQKQKITGNEFLSLPVVYNAKMIRKAKLLTPTKGTLKRSNKVISFRIKEIGVIHSLSYYSREGFKDIKDYTIKDGVFEFDIDISKLRSKELMLYINNEATYGFRIR
jgi:hypothetical protein